MAEPTRHGPRTSGDPGRARDEPEPELRDVPVELIAPNPHQPRRRFDDETLLAWPIRSGPGACCSPFSSARCRRPLRTHRRRAPLAGGPAGRARDVPALVREHDDATIARGGADREHGPRGPQPGRGGPGLRRADRGARPHARGGRSPRRPKPRRGVQPPPAPRPARRGARAHRGRRAHRGTRSRPAAGRDHPARRRLARDARVRPVVGARLEARARAGRRPEASWRKARAVGFIPTRRGGRARSPTPWGGAGADVLVAPAATGYRARAAFESLDAALALAAPRRAPSLARTAA